MEVPQDQFNLGGHLFQVAGVRLQPLLDREALHVEVDMGVIGKKRDQGEEQGLAEELAVLAGPGSGGWVGLDLDATSGRRNASC